MKDLAKFKTAIQTYPAGLYTLSTSPDLSPQEVEQIVQECGFRVLYIDGRTITNDEQLITALNEVTHYPYSAHNWDAVWDYMTGDLLYFLPASGYVLLYDNFQELQKPNRGIFLDTDTVLQVLMRIAEVGDPKMLILLRGDLQSRSSLPQFDSAPPPSDSA